RKLKLIYSVSVVVGHGAAHRHRGSDGGKRRGGWSGSKSWGALIQPNDGWCQETTPPPRNLCDRSAIKPVLGVGGLRVRRRAFIRRLGGAAISAPLAAYAQQVGKPPMIGFLGASSRVAVSSWTDAFVQRLGELGWIDGRNVAIVYRWAEGRPERARELAK